MNHNPQSSNTDAETLAVARKEVKDLLTRSEAFRALPPDQQREIAKNTVEIATYLAAPEGIRATNLPAAPGSVSDDDPYAVGLADPPSSRSRSRSRGNNIDEDGVFSAQGAREGAEVAGALLRNVNFPEFVSGLITGVFDSIVDSSIKQMEAYGELVKSVAQTLNQFRDENVSANQGRDHLVESFPDLFEVSIDTGDDFFGESGGGPRVRLREGVDEDSAVQRVNQQLPIEGEPIRNLDDDVVDGQLVQAARTQLATSRQQLLATMVLMGINRIVVTDGKISAKVLYNFQARDNMQFRKSATHFDYDPTAQRTVREGEYERDYQGGERNYSREDGKVDASRRGASYYAKGKYKTTSEPVLTMADATQTNIDASLETRASLAGVVEVNFKSDFLPLEKMADSFQVAMIQDAAKPSGGNGGRGVGTGTNTGNNTNQSAPQA